MRVAHVNQDPGVKPGRAKGAAVHLDAMRTAFRALGHECFEFDEPDDGRVRGELEQAHARAPLDFIYERYALDARGAHDFASDRRLPLVLEVNAPLLDEDCKYRGRTLTGADVELETRVFSAASVVLAISNGVADYVQARGVSRGRILVRPNGVDAERFRPRASVSVRRRHGIPEDAFVIGFHGRLRPWHGFELLVEVFRKLVIAGERVHLLALGTGPFEEHLEGLDEHTTVVPWMPQAECAELVACFDALPLTYGADAPCYFSPLKLLEAMACAAVPVVVNRGDLRAVVQHLRNGLVYRAGDALGLRQQLLTLLNDPGLRERLGSRATMTAAGRSWNALAHEVCELVQERASL